MQHDSNHNSMVSFTRRIAGIIALVIVSACSTDNGAPLLTSETCLSMGGTVLGDPGDGSVLSPEYLCPNGEPPVGTILFTEGEPMAVEGAVCCLP